MSKVAHYAIDKELKIPVTPAPQTWRSLQLKQSKPLIPALIVVALVSGMQGADPALHSVALPAAAEALGMDAGLTGFIKSLGTMVLAASMLGVGVLGDRIGRRKTLVAGAGLMVFASLLAAIAPTAPILMLARIFMGFGTAMSFAMAIAFIPTMFPAAKLPQIFGIFFALGGSLIVISTVTSGAIQATFGWRGTYGIMALVAAIMTFAAWLTLPENRADERGKVDPVGIVLAGLGLIALVYSIGQVPSEGWGSAIVLIGLAVSLVAFTCFVFWENKVENPAFPVDLFKIPAFTAACLTGVLFNFADASILGQFPAAALPAGVNATVVALIIALMYLGMVVGAPSAGFVQSRFGVSDRSMFVSGLLLCAIGLGIQVLVKDMHALLIPTIGFFVIGFAVMWMQNPESAVIMRSAPPEKLAATGAVKPAVGQFGFGLGFALAGPISSIFDDSDVLTAVGYGKGLFAEAVLFVFAAFIIFFMTKQKPTKGDLA